MKTSHNSKILDLLDLCADPRADDGIAPHILKKQQRKEEGRAAKLNSAHSLRYCKAVRQCLDSVLASLGDDRLADLTIQLVEPQRSHAKLLVVVGVGENRRDTIPEIEEILAGVAGSLRSAVASEIRRKRTPHLSFRVVVESDAETLN